MKRLQIYVLNMNFFTSTFTALLESELFVSVKAPTHSQLLCTSWIRLHTTINKANLNEQCPTVLYVMGRPMIPFFNFPNPILIFLKISLHNSGPMHQISAEFSCSWLLLENWPVHDFGLRADWTCEWKLSCEDGMDSVCTITSHPLTSHIHKHRGKYANTKPRTKWPDKDGMDLVCTKGCQPPISPVSRTTGTGDTLFRCTNQWSGWENDRTPQILVFKGVKPTIFVSDKYPMAKRPDVLKQNEDCRLSTKAAYTSEQTRPGLPTRNLH